MSHVTLEASNAAHALVFPHTVSEVLDDIQWKYSHKNNSEDNLRGTFSIEEETEERTQPT